MHLDWPLSEELIDLSRPDSWPLESYPSELCVGVVPPFASMSTQPDLVPDLRN